MTRDPGYYRLLPWMVICFFFNSILLPEGLLYTTLLTPVMVYLLFRYRVNAPSPAWLILLALPLPVQWLRGVDPPTFLLSSLLTLTAFLFLMTASLLIARHRTAVPALFRTLLLINAMLVFLALITWPVPWVRETLWYSVPLTAGVESITRLRLFTYEPSYYGLLMMPVFLYFLLRVASGMEKHPLMVAAACLVPLLLSLSFGIIGALALATLLAIPFYLRYLPLQSRRILLYALVSTGVVTVVTALAWPENPVFVRIANIFGGRDTSAMGRLVYSFMFARDLAEGHGWLFGIGPGQIKVLAHDLIVNHYRYHGEVAETVRIPNAMAEMLATFGVYGFALKLFFEAWFFVKRKIYRNLYACILFLFLFIYQFTGSFIVNIAELAGWVFVFSSRFPEFDIPKVPPGKEVDQ